MPQVIIAVIVTLVVAIPITYFVATSYFKKASEANDRKRGRQSERNNR